MSAFFNDVLDDFLTPVFLEGVRKKFHFSQSQMTEVQTVAKRMIPWMRKEAFWERKAYLMHDQRLTEKKDPVYEVVVISLGRGIDCLQGKYSEREQLLNSYIIEALASEILLRSYDAYDQYIRNETGWYVAGYHFPGSEAAFPLDMLPDLLKECAPQITCSDAFCMTPSKSVAFISELTRDEKISCESICQSCNNRHCPNRVETKTAEK